MKSITVACDLGPATDALVDFVGNLAMDFEAESIHLVHVHRLFADNAFTPASFLAEQEALRGLQDVAQRIREFTHAWVKTDYQVVYGSVESAILRVAGDSDLLVMGQTMNTGMWRVVMGDVTEGVLENSDCPVLVVPEGARFKRPERIALAVDDKPMPDDGMAFLRTIAQTYASELDVFHRDDRDDDRPGEELQNRLAGINFTYHFDRGEGDLTEYIVGAAEGARADWLAIIHHRRPRWQEWLNRNQSERIAEVATMPILILEDRDPARALARRERVREAQRAYDAQAERAS